jgi:hypothetical protein
VDVSAGVVAATADVETGATVSARTSERWATNVSETIVARERRRM